MKKIIVSAIILLCLFIAIPFTLSAAEENLSFEKDGCVVKNGVMIRYKGSASHLILPEGIRSINLMYEGYFDSADTSMVTELTLPDSFANVNDADTGILNISRESFWCFSNLEAIHVKSTNTLFTEIDGVLFSKDKKTLYFYPENKGHAGCVYRIPPGTLFVNADILTSNPSIGTLEVPASVVDFFNISRVNSSLCALQCINVDPANEYYSSEDGVLYNKDKTQLVTYPVAKKDTEFFLPASVADILNIYSLYYNEYLQSFNADKNNRSYTSIDGVLYDKKISELIYYPGAKTDETYTLPDTLNKINFRYRDFGNIKSFAVSENNPFFSALDGVLYDKNKMVLYRYPSAKDDKDTFVIPDTVCRIESDSIDSYLNKNIKTIVIPASVREIGYISIYNIEKLEVAENTTGHLYALSNGIEFKLMDGVKTEPVELGNISLSPKKDKGFAPSYTNRLYVNVPVKLNIPDYYAPVTIFMSVSTADGKQVCSIKKEQLTSGALTLEWNGMAAASNPAGISTSSYVPQGDYVLDIKAYVTVNGKNYTYEKTENVKVLAPVTPSAYGEDQTNLVPIYTDNIRLDYMVKKILDQIIVPEMSNYQKIKAVYDWIIKSCIHTEDPVCYHCENNTHYFNDDNMIIEGSEMNARYNRLRNNGEVNMIVTNGAINNNQWLNKYNKSEIDQKYWGLVFNISKAEDIMYHRRGVCSYFASLFMVMVNQLGFESGVTEGTFVNYSGKTSYHVWNYIKLNGSYYWIDTDIEHLNYVNNKKIAYTYFLKKDPEWSDKHIWDKAAYPACN